MAIFHTSELPGRTVRLTGGREFLWFSGTDYLGMGHNESFRNALSTGLEVYGNHFGSSRNNSLRLAIYEQAEAALARFTGAQSAMIVSSGMWAGQLVMKEIEAITGNRSQGLSYHYAPNVHPALWGNHFTSSRLTWNEWALQTVSIINGSRGHVHIICTDAIGSPLVTAFDFTIFNRITDVSNVWLIVDESHSLGVNGPGGSGVGGLIDPRFSAQTIFVSSLNKAMGIPAGAIWSNSLVTDALRLSPWYAGASPPAPVYIFALHALLEKQVYSGAIASLRENIEHFSRQSTDLQLFESIPDYPVFCSMQPELFTYLLDHGIMASHFAYPSPADAPVTRIALSSLHQKEDLDRLAEVCKQFVSTKV